MSVVDDYLENVALPQRTELKRIREIIKRTVPDAEETITYGMPGFKYKGKYLISFAAFKDHLSLFPGAEPISVLKEQLKDNITGKGTLQFTLEKSLSEEVVVEIAELCKERIDER